MYRKTMMKFIRQQIIGDEPLITIWRKEKIRMFGFILLAISIFINITQANRITEINDELIEVVNSYIELSMNFDNLKKQCTPK